MSVRAADLSTSTSLLSNPTDSAVIAAKILGELDGAQEETPVGMCEGLGFFASICGAIDQSTRCSGFTTYCRLRSGLWSSFNAAWVWPAQHISLADFTTEKDEFGPSRSWGGELREELWALVLDKAESVGIKIEKGLHNFFFFFSIFF